MFTSIINTEFLTLRGTSELEQLDEHMLADIGVERHGNVFVYEGTVVSNAPSSGRRNFFTLLANVLGGYRSVWNAHA
jgi:hypothetical protein